MIIVVCQTILTAVLFPSVGIDSLSYEDAWRGVLGHKNTTGRIMVLASLTLWISARQRVLSPPLAWSALAGAVFVVIMSQSRTSYLVLAFIALCLVALQILRRSTVPVFLRVLTVVSLFLMPLTLLVLNYYQAGLEALDRDATLTGRTSIWERAIEVGMENSWFGVGYRSFWTGQDLPQGLSYGHGHNSFLDVWLELGLVGAGLCLATGIAAARRAFWRLTHTSNPFGSFYILFLISLALFGLTSQVFPHQGTVEWALFVVLLIHLAPLPNSAASRRKASADLAPFTA
jgi:O-antigen ligase